MAQIQGLEGMTGTTLSDELERGARFVVFEYTISILIMTFKRGSDVFFIRAGEGTMGKSLPYTFITLLFGWWGFPWGPIYSIASLVTNFGGGKNVTDGVLQALSSPTGEEEELQSV